MSFYGPIHAEMEKANFSPTTNTTTSSSKMYFIDLKFRTSNGVNKEPTHSVQKMIS